MKVSASVRSDTAVTPGTATLARPVLLVAGAYLALHLPSLAPSLEDIDSINFALGLHHFDPALHQPHPPGYPVYIALGRLSRLGLAFVAPLMDSVRLDALALAVWSAIGGAVALAAAGVLFREFESGPGAETPPPAWRRPSTAAVVLLAVAPLFWLSGLRPMSDVPGLAAALVAQALLVLGLRRPGCLMAGALVAGLGAGLRSQTAVLTVPLLAYVLVRVQLDAHGTRWRSAVGAVAALGAGGLVWIAPLLVATGGLAGYLRALQSQAGEDFAWVDMLWSNPTPRRLAFSLYETFVLPWASPGAALVVGATAGLGLLVMLVRERRAMGLLCLAFGPYVAFHLLFQETATVRYALPVLPAAAWLSARGIAAVGAAAGAAAGLGGGRGVGRLVAPVLSLVLAATLAADAVRAGIDYGAERHPAFRAVSALAADVATAPPGRVYAHYSLYRPLQAAPSSLPIVAPVRGQEWLGPVDYWKTGGTGPVWFLADPRRTDLDLIDPSATRRVESYRWGVAERPELRGARPVGADWYRIDPPGWFLGTGWSLTPETGGNVRAAGTGLDHRPIEAFVRRRAEPTTIMIGGYHLGGAGGAASQLTLTLDGAPVDRWAFDPRANGPAFLRFIDLPSGVPAGPGRYARLAVAAAAVEPSRPTPEVAIRQFDLQSGARPILGFGEGWHEVESDPATRRRWRWTSDRSVLRIVGVRPVTLMLRAESPMKYFEKPPVVRLRAGGEVVAELHPTAEIAWRVAVPADALRRAGGVLVLDIDQVYLPGQAEGTADTRRLGLRVFECVVEYIAD